MRALTALVLVAGIVLLLFTVVFPWAEPLLPFTDVTVDDPGSVTVPESTPSP